MSVNSENATNAPEQYAAEDTHANNDKISPELMGKKSGITWNS